MASTSDVMVRILARVDPAFRTAIEQARREMQSLLQGPGGAGGATISTSQMGSAFTAQIQAQTQLQAQALNQARSLIQQVAQEAARATGAIFSASTTRRGASAIVNDQRAQVAILRTQQQETINLAEAERTRAAAARANAAEYRAQSAAQLRDLRALTEESRRNYINIRAAAAESRERDRQGDRIDRELRRQFREEDRRDREAQRAQRQQEAREEREQQQQQRAATAQQRQAAREAAAEQRRLRAQEAEAERLMRQEFSLTRNQYQAVSTIIGGLTSVFAGLSAELINVAEKFDYSRAKLMTVVKDGAEAMKIYRDAIQFALTTPFTVDHVVNAAAQLRVFRQDVQLLLPVAGDLAASMGKNIDEAATALGKAMEGSASGVRQLTNSFGISRTQLRLYGAEVNNMGGVLLRTQEQVDKFRTAVLGIVRDNFAGGMRLQLNTIIGALSNFKDSVMNTFRAFGEALEPYLVPVIKYFSALIRVVNDIVPFKGFVGIMVVVGAGLGAITTFVTGLMARLMGMAESIGLNTVAFMEMANAEGIVAASTAVLSEATAILTGRVMELGSSLATFAIMDPWLLPIAIFAGVFLSYAGYAQMAIDATADLTKQQEENTAKVNNAIKTWETYLTILDNVMKMGGEGELNDPIKNSMSTAEKLVKIRERLALMPPVVLFDVMSKEGVNVEQLEIQLAKVREQAEATRNGIDAVQAAINSLNGGSGSVTFANLGGETADRLRALFANASSATSEELERKLTQLSLMSANLEPAQAAMAGILEKVRPIADGFELITQKLHGMNDFMRFSKNASDVSVLTFELQKMDEIVAETAEDLRKLGLVADEAALRDKLLDPNLPKQEREAILAYLQALQQRSQKSRDIDSQREKDAREHLQQMQVVFDDQHVAEAASTRETMDLKTAELQWLKANGYEQTSIYATTLHERNNLHKKYDKELRDQYTSGLVANANEAVAAAQGDKSRQAEIYRNLIRSLEAYGDQSKETLAKINAAKANLARVSAEAVNEQLQRADEAYFKSLDGILNRLRSSFAPNALAIIGELGRQVEDLERRLSTARTDTQRRNIQNQIDRRREEQRSAEEAAEKKSLDIAEKLLEKERERLSLSNDIYQDQLSRGKNVQAQIIENLKTEQALAFSLIDQKYQKEFLATKQTAEDRANVDRMIAIEKTKYLEDERKRVDQIIESQSAGARNVSAMLDEIERKYGGDKRMGGAGSPLQSLAEVGEQMNAVFGGGPLFGRFNLMRLDDESKRYKGPGQGPVDQLEQYRRQLDSNTRTAVTNLGAFSNALYSATNRLNTAIGGSGGRMVGTPSAGAYSVGGIGGSGPSPMGMVNQFGYGDAPGQSRPGVERHVIWQKPGGGNAFYGNEVENSVRARHDAEARQHANQTNSSPTTSSSTSTTNIHTSFHLNGLDLSGDEQTTLKRLGSQLRTRISNPEDTGLGVFGR